jgi:hypothetical protein
VITDDLSKATEALADRQMVVLVAATAVVAPDPGAGRLAHMVGDPDDPAVRAAAEEMEGELFGAPPAGWTV